MIRILIGLILFLVKTSNLGSTTFVPIPIGEQLKRADGVIYAVFQSKTYKKKFDQIVTEASFKIKSSVGIPAHKLINKNNFKIVYPGGIWNGKKYRTYGAPEFRVGEESILILKESIYGMTVKGQELGKYLINRGSNGTYLSSVAFPKHAHLGKIIISKFEEEIKVRFGERFSFIKLDVHVDKYKVSKTIKSLNNNSDKVPGRAPASILDSPSEVEGEKNTGPSDTQLFWPFALFVLFGLFSKINARKNSKK